MPDDQTPQFEEATYDPLSTLFCFRNSICQLRVPHVRVERAIAQWCATRAETMTAGRDKEDV